MNTLWEWAAINLVWSAILAVATSRLFFLSRQWERRIEKENRYLREQERKQRML